MEFLSKEATGLECNVASLSSPATEWQTVHQFSLIILLQAFKHSISRSSIQRQLSQFCSLDQYAHAAEHRYSSLKDRLQTCMLSQTTRTAKRQGTSITYGWWLPRCHTAQSKAVRRWYCARNMWGLSRCTPHCIYGEKCLGLVSK